MRRTDQGTEVRRSSPLFGNRPGAAVWYFVPTTARGVNPSSNSIMVVAPYWYKGTWVFDDPAVGLSANRSSLVFPR